MATMAKILGILSLVASVAVGSVALVVGLVVPAQGTYDDEAAGEAFLIAVGLGALSLILAAVGAAAWCAGKVVGEMADAAMGAAEAAPGDLPQLDTSIRHS